MALPDRALDANRRQWVHIIPAGTTHGRDGRGPYRLVNPQAVIEASRKRQGKTRMLIDYEHQSMHAERNGKPVPAAGWIVGMQARATGIWALTEWTEKAAAHIREREYSYVSPVLLTDRKGEILRVLNVALTNSPNLETLTALSREELRMKTEKTAMPGEGDVPKEMAEILAMLGLPEDSGLADIVKAIQALMAQPNSANPDPAQFVPIGDYQRSVKELNELRQGVSEMEAKQHVEGHVRAGNMAPYMKEWAISLCKVNKPRFDEFIQQVAPTFNKLTTPMAHLTTFNPDKHDNNVTPDEYEIARRMGLTAEEYAKGKE